VSSLHPLITLLSLVLRKLLISFGAPFILVSFFLVKAVFATLQETGQMLTERFKDMLGLGLYSVI
jgi:hypothetical protein